MYGACTLRPEGRRKLYGRTSGLSAKRTPRSTSEADIEHETHVANLGAGEVLEDGYQVEQLIVVSIREPAADWDGVLGMEDVRCRRVVDNDGVLQIPADLRQVLGLKLETA
jgi:hypothetical protein